MKRILFVAWILLVSSVCVSYAQDGMNTSYFLSNFSQRFRLNPAYQPEYKAFIGLPGLSGVSVNYLNSSFTPEKFLEKRNDSVYMNINKFYDGLHKRNYMMVNNENSLLTVGVRIKKWYATLDIVQKNDVLFRYNKDIFTFLKYGNMNQSNMDFGKLGVNADSYLEVALGLSRKVNDRLTVGGRLKYLNGIANVRMTDSELGIRTEADGTLTLYSRQNIKMMAPVNIRNKQTGMPFPENQPIEWDDLDFDVDDISVSDVLNTKNPGFAIDLGGEYKMTDRITLFASVTDLGFIHWGNEEFGYNFIQDAEFKWEGADISGAISGDDESVNDAFDNLVDSLKTNFRLSRKSASYTTMLSPKIYLGGTYRLNRMFEAGALLRASVVNGMFLPAFTASVNGRFIRNVSASVSYTATRGSYANIGAGITAKLGPLQLYASTDNLLACNYTNTKSINARVGINLLFGHNDRRKRNKVKEEPDDGVIVIAPVPVKKAVEEKDTTLVDPVVPMTEEDVKPLTEEPVYTCYAIVGSFKSKERAYALQQQLVKMGFTESSVLVNEQGMFRVSAVHFDNHDACWEEVFRIRKKYPQFRDAWGLSVGDRKF